jgi:cytidylate kinase
VSKKITIAIDGFSSTGKSTIAKQLAKHLGYVYVDTGAMYRAVTYFAMQNGYIAADFFDKQTLINSLSSIKLHFEFNPEFGFAEMYLNDANIEKEIRTLEVSNFVSLVAEVSEVRAKLVEQQQEMGKGKGIVMDGRDIGTTVFPEAELKIFVTADVAIRAERRYKELYAKNPNITIEEITNNLAMRDYIDSNREVSPLRKADDAIVLDNSNLTRKEQLKLVLGWVKAKLT